MSRIFEVHLLYASVVWIAAWLLTSLPRGSATAKYWIWVLTSINFILPLSAIPAPWWPSRTNWLAAPMPVEGFRSNAAIAAIWIGGAAILFVRLVVRMRADAPAAPAVLGFVRPRIHLPADVRQILDRDELEAVLIHEQRHASRRDNLIRLIHEASLCFLWFHPLVWLTRSRLGLYRELSCDESVIRRGRAASLVSALAKIAGAQQGALLQSTASSFVCTRLAYLTATRRTGRTATAVIVAAFAFVLLVAITGPIAQACAAYACELTHRMPR